MTRHNIEPLTPASRAALFLFWLEQRGACITLDAADYFRCDLDPIADMTAHDAECIAAALLTMRDDVRAILLARRIRH
jgi:hypothetical protein